MYCILMLTYSPLSLCVTAVVCCVRTCLYALEFLAGGDNDINFFLQSLDWILLSYYQNAGAWN